MGLQSLPGMLNPVCVHIHSDGPQTSQHMGCSVDVIYAPTAIPGSILLLLRPEKAKPLMNSGMTDTKLELRKNLEDPSCDIWTAGIENCLVIREGEISKKGALNVSVERGPAPIAALKTHEPVKTRPHDGSVREVGCVERQHHHGGVVNVRVKWTPGLSVSRKARRKFRSL